MATAAAIEREHRLCGNDPGHQPDEELHELIAPEVHYVAAYRVARDLLALIATIGRSRHPSPLEIAHINDR